MVRSLSQKKFRDELGLFVAEGEKCVGELEKHFQLVLRIDATAHPRPGSEVATQSEIEQMSNLRTPQGVIGVFRKGGHADGEVVVGEIRGLVLALDGVQDPGNLGTIIRTADWFGIEDIYCSTETADCYSPKVVQATMGALARVRVHQAPFEDAETGRSLNLKEWIEARKKVGVPVYGTLLEGRNMYEEGAIPQKECGVIVMGNEGNGISPAVREIISHPLLIPNFPAGRETSESLNVAIATAIVLAEFRR